MPGAGLPKRAPAQLLGARDGSATPRASRKRFTSRADRFSRKLVLDIGERGIEAGSPVIDISAWSASDARISIDAE